MSTNSLSEDERAILRLLRSDLSDSEIAAVLFIGRRTVQRRLKSLMDRAGAKNRFALGEYAARSGWLPDDRRPGANAVRSDMLAADVEFG